MRLDQGKIPSSQLTFLAYGYMMGSSTILAPGLGAKQSAWLAIFAGALIGLGFVWIYSALSKRFPGKTLTEINDLVYGPYLGKLVSIAFIWYFFHLGSIVLRDFGDYFKLFMTGTPLPIFVIVIIAVCAYAVYSGIEVIARTSLVLVPVILLTYILDTLFIIPSMDLSNLMPVFHLPWQEFLRAAYGAASFPFGESAAFLMVLAFLNKPEQAHASLNKAVILTAVFLAMASARNIAVMGPVTFVQTYPAHSLVSMINIANVITRIEILVSVNFAMMGFLKISVLYFAVILGVSQMLKMKNHKPLIWPIGILMVNFSLLQFNSTVENINFSVDIYPFYTMPFQLFLPLLTLLVAMIRKMTRPSEGGASS